MTVTFALPIQRGFALVVTLALVLAGTLPLVAPPAGRAVSTTVTISEVYGGGGNPGAKYAHDFIELYNLTDASIDLSGLSLQYASASGSGNFGANSGQLTELSGIIPAGGYFLVREFAGDDGGPALPTPDLIDASPINMSGSSGKVALVTGTTSLGCNGGSTPCDADQLSRIVDLVGWGSANFFEGTAAAPGTSNSTSVQRVDPADDNDENSTDFVAAAPTPMNSGIEPPPAEPVEIWEIQGAGHLSPFDGEAVTGVEGIVTAVSGFGFWMEDPTPDDDLVPIPADAEATSNGIFVFRGVAEVGDHVTVDGTVDEFRPGGGGGFENLTTTEILNPTVEVLSSGNPLPLTVIGADRLPPTVIIDDDSTTSVEAGDALFDPENDGIDFWESLEGMRIQVADAVAVGPRNNFGEIAVISQLQLEADARTPRGGIIVRNLSGTGDYVPGDFNPERLLIDDALSPTPFVNVGDEFETDPVGVLDYSFGAPKLLVTANPGRVDNGLVREVTTAQGPHDLAVATYNVENLSVVNDQAKFDELAGQIVNHLRSPDIIGIEEMQDDSGSTNDGTVNADGGWQRLIDAVVAAGGPEYEFRSIDPENNADGGAPGSNIRVGFLYREDRGVVFVDRPGGDAVTDTDVVPTPSGKAAQLTISPGRVLDSELGGDKAFEDTRKSLAGEFMFRGEKLFVVVNHFSSKGDDRPLFGHFQPPFRLTEFESGDPEDGWRHAQAQAVNDFVDEILAVDDDAHVIVLGDINDFDFSETVKVLTGERLALDPGPFQPDENGSGQTAASGEIPVLTTLFELLPPDERYSYVFEGNSQVLDQILVSSSLWELGVTYDVVHVNAEFADQASDHDPSVMRVAFQPRGRR